MRRLTVGSTATLPSPPSSAKRCEASFFRLFSCDYFQYFLLLFADPKQQANGYGQEPFKARALTLTEESNIDRAADLLDPLLKRCMVVKAANTAFGLRGGEAWQLTVSAITFGTDSAGRVYVEYDPLRVKNLADQDAVLLRFFIWHVFLFSSLHSFYSHVFRGGNQRQGA